MYAIRSYYGVVRSRAREHRDPTACGRDHDLDHLAVLEVGQRRGFSRRAARNQLVDAGRDLAFDQLAQRCFVVV